MVIGSQNAIIWTVKLGVLISIISLTGDQMQHFEFISRPSTAIAVKLSK